ncbi:MAG: hypothetical protein EOO73_34265 [Myxococcales bacterium]|nr:MAG: hypothetical protein EOO73_34265 [Myxococcales bacterium]
MNPLELRQQLSNIEQSHGLAEASREAGLAKATVLRILAGLDVREGTLLTAQRHLSLSTVPTAGELPA